VAGVKLRPSGGDRRAASVDADRFAARLGQNPEAVAADRVHVRIDHGNGGGHGDHGLGGAAALAQHAPPASAAKWWGATAMPP
jgi:hypothetical protein